jgi:lectin-like protein
MRGAPALVVLCGCRSILGIHGLEDGRDDAPPPDTVTPDVLGDGAGACPTGFDPLPGGSAHRYRMESGSDLFDSQVNFCVALSAGAGYLAIPDDQIELDGMRVLTTTNFWVGIDDLQTEGTYLTVNGTVATFLPFASGEPTGNAQQNCLFVDTIGKLHDQDCSTNLPAICECEPGGQVSGFREN